MAVFEHRFPFESVQALGIKGGIEIHKIEFKGFNLRTVSMLRIIHIYLRRAKSLKP
uniref:Galectin domain-containing protein n=1 Tax=Ascaris lumbricoides TaxID=6252 RepID=A0A0M3HXG2_ASCLU